MRNKIKINLHSDTSDLPEGIYLITIPELSIYGIFVWSSPAATGSHHSRNSFRDNGLCHVTSPVLLFTPGPQKKWESHLKLPKLEGTIRILIERKGALLVMGIGCKMVEKAPKNHFCDWAHCWRRRYFNWICWIGEMQFGNINWNCSLSLIRKTQIT